MEHFDRGETGTKTPRFHTARVNRDILTVCRSLLFYPDKQTFWVSAGMSQTVESRMGAVAGGQRPSPRFPSPLIEPDLRRYRIRLSDWLHREAHDGAVNGRRSRRRSPRSP